MRAYDKDYLPGAMDTLGHMIDYAVNGIGLDAAFFYRLFLSSGIADSFGSGHPRFVAGLSGRELARLVITSVSDLEIASDLESFGARHFLSGISRLMAWISRPFLVCSIPFTKQMFPGSWMWVWTASGSGRTSTRPR